MAETGIRTGVNPAPFAEPRPVTLKQPQSVTWQVVKRILAPAASLRVTVVLFTLAIILVFFGTLAQIDQGIWTVVKNYFRSFYVFIPFQLLVQFGQKFFEVSPDARLPGGFPFPGGWTIGTLLLINVIAAHLVRFKLAWKRSGILVLHAGLIILFASELVTGKFAVEGHMQIREGQSSNFVIHNRYSELAIINPADPKTDDVVVIPEWMLRKGGTISHPDLPFDVEVKQYLVNSVLRRPSRDSFALEAIAQREVSGTESGVDVPAAYLTLRDKKDGSVLAEDLLVSVYLVPFRDPDDGKYYADATVAGERRVAKVPYTPVVAGGQEYEVALRFKRSYKPYTVHLLNFSFDRYMGTNKAKNFSSEVRLIDPERNEDRTVVISMNEPMMHRGETFYQAGFDEETEKATVLQVVRDPGKPLPWLSLPYLGCAVVALGMLVHFGITLVGFLARRATP